MWKRREIVWDVSAVGSFVNTLLLEVGPSPAASGTTFSRARMRQHRVLLVVLGLAKDGLRCLGFAFVGLRCNCKLKLDLAGRKVRGCGFNSRDMVLSGSGPARPSGPSGPADLVPNARRVSGWRAWKSRGIAISKCKRDRDTLDTAL